LTKESIEKFIQHRKKKVSSLIVINQTTKTSMQSLLIKCHIAFVLQKNF